MQYAKTEILQPGEAQTLKITFRYEDMASYDSNGIKSANGAYVLEAGNYKINLCSDSHTILDTYVAKVDKDKCTGCGACANICPKKVIMIDVGGPRKPVVMCSNQDKGAVANKLCTTSCIACGMCERTCKFDAIHVVDNVARVDYDLSLIHI